MSHNNFTDPFCATSSTWHGSQPTKSWPCAIRVLPKAVLRCKGSRGMKIEEMLKRDPHTKGAKGRREWRREMDNMRAKHVESMGTPLSSCCYHLARPDADSCGSQSPLHPTTTTGSIQASPALFATSSTDSSCSNTQTTRHSRATRRMTLFSLG